jgi:hypothetical protein
MKKIRISNHARRRARQRHPDFAEGEMIDMAELARECGAVGPGNNGCRRYKFLGREFVFDEKERTPVLVTVA